MIVNFKVCKLNFRICKIIISEQNIHILKNKIICQALFTLVRHSSPLHLSSLSLLRSRKQLPPPPTQPIRLQSPTGASFFIMFFIFKIYVCIFIYLTEILVQREKFDFNN